MVTVEKKTSVRPQMTEDLPEKRVDGRKFKIQRGFLFPDFQLPFIYFFFPLSLCVGADFSHLSTCVCSPLMNCIAFTECLVRSGRTHCALLSVKQITALEDPDCSPTRNEEMAPNFVSQVHPKMSVFSTSLGVCDTKKKNSTQETESKALYLVLTQQSCYHLFHSHHRKGNIF